MTSMVIFRIFDFDKDGIVSIDEINKLMRVLDINADEVANINAYTNEIFLYF